MRMHRPRRRTTHTYTHTQNNRKTNDKKMKLWRKQFAFSKIKASKFTHFLNLKYLNKVFFFLFLWKAFNWFGLCDPSGALWRCNGFQAIPWKLIFFPLSFIYLISHSPSLSLSFDLILSHSAPIHCASRLVFLNFNFLSWRVYSAMHTELPHGYWN